VIEDVAVIHPRARSIIESTILCCCGLVEWNKFFNVAVSPFWVARESIFRAPLGVV